MEIIAWLAAEAWPYILGALAVVGGLFGLHRASKQQGREEVKQEQQAAQSEQRRKINEADSNLVELDDDDIRSDLAKWVRRKDR